MKTDVKVSTTSCVNCGRAHSGFRVKKNSSGVEYVICGAGKDAKRVDIKYHNPKSKNPYQPRTWTID